MCKVGTLRAVRSRQVDREVVYVARKRQYIYLHEEEKIRT
jgi:hypothetical protein